MVFGKKMASKSLQFYLKKYLAGSKQSKVAGFTLLELLMAIAVAGIVLYGMLSLVVNLLGIEQKETAKSQVQQEMDQAMDYIAADLQKAVYIYDGDCVAGGVGSPGDPDYCPGLDNILGFSSENVIPVVAFWKLEEVPYRNPTTTAAQQLPTDCTSLPASDQNQCYALKTGRHTNTLVIYALDPDPSNTWDGPATITRYQLRKYDPEQLSTLTLTTNFVDPTTTEKSYQTWPCNTDGTNCLAQQSYAGNNDVLVDLVDKDLLSNNPPTCADYPNYSLTGDNAHSSFYACVKPPELGSGNFQDAIVFLRGNAAEKAGESGSRNTVYLPSLQRRIQARSLYETTPSDL
ncbi:type II secretion system GspH family protein [Phormidium sp. CCY1219]|nr:type II secretion system GspH family protein [Phormidium sp. CCY1219]